MNIVLLVPLPLCCANNNVLSDSFLLVIALLSRRNEILNMLFPCIIDGESKRQTIFEVIHNAMFLCLKIDFIYKAMGDC